MSTDNTTLLRAAAEGDDEAWATIVERHGALVWSLARGYRLNGADTGDAVQTTWLRLVENLDRIADPDRLPGWLATTVRRECLRLLRRAGRERVGLQEQWWAAAESAAPPPDAQLLLDERDAVLRRAFAAIPPQQRLLLQVLMTSPPPTYATVAQLLGMPIGSIGPARRRALERLRLAITSGDREPCVA